jgi:hypothetical protein
MLPPVPVITQTFPASRPAQLGDHRERRGRSRPGVRQPLDRGAMRGLRTATDGVGDVQHVVPVLQRRNGGEREADLCVEPADYQPPSPGCLHGLPEGLVLERVH